MEYGRKPEKVKKIAVIGEHVIYESNRGGYVIVNHDGLRVKTCAEFTEAAEWAKDRI